MSPPRIRQRPMPPAPPEPVLPPPTPPPRFDAYRRTGEQYEWRTSEFRREVYPSGVPDDYSDWDAPADEEDDEPTRPTNYLAAAVAALGWFLVPVTIYLGYAFLLDNKPPPGCTGTGTPECLTPRAEAFQNLFGNVPLVTITVSVSILIALVLRKVASGWRTVTIGFASAVVGAGAATVLFTVLNG
jgi:hypothetical protein